MKLEGVHSIASATDSTHCPSCASSIADDGSPATVPTPPPRIPMRRRLWIQHFAPTLSAHTPMTTNTHNLLASSRSRLWIPSAHTYTHFRPDHDVLRQSMYSCDHFCFSRDTVVADSPSASGPGKTGNDSCMSPLERPFRYSHDPAASNDRDLRTYGGTSIERNVTASPVRARTFGILTATGPMPVCTIRSG